MQISMDRHRKKPSSAWPPQWESVNRCSISLSWTPVLSQNTDIGKEYHCRASRYIRHEAGWRGPGRRHGISVGSCERPRWRCCSEGAQASNPRDGRARHGRRRGRFAWPGREEAALSRCPQDFFCTIRRCTQSRWRFIYRLYPSSSRCSLHRCRSLLAYHRVP